MSPRSRRWPLISAIVLIATIAAVILGSRIARRMVTRLRPGATVVLDIDSARPYRAGVDRDAVRRQTLARLSERLDHLGGGLFAATGDRVQVVLPRYLAPEIAARQLTRSGRLEFKLVDDGSDTMKTLVQCAVPNGVDIGHDAWTERESGAPHHDLFLQGPDRDALAAVIRRCGTAIPTDHELDFERTRQHNGEVGWRTHYVFARTELDGDSISDAEVSYDQQTGRPEVSFTFDEAGAKAFEAATARAVGHKLAILLEGTVQSAPVIEGKITGGHARITMGGATSPAALQQDAIDLVAILRVGALPAPVSLVEIRPVR